MIFPPDHVIVLGHRNPDTDASTSAAGYASFLRRTRAYDAPVVAGIPGVPTPQSEFVFRRAGVPPPPTIDSLLPRVCDVATRSVDSVPASARLRDAVESLIRTDRGMLPVVDAEGKLQSVFSHRRDSSRFLFAMDVVPLLSSLLDWTDLLEMPGATPAGVQPEDRRLRGGLVLALEGDASWRGRLEPDDVLLCGGESVLEAVSPERLPRWIVLASCERVPDPERIARLNARGSAVVCYRFSALDFVSVLPSQVRLGSLSLDTGPCVGELDYLHDVEEIVRESRHALPVLGPEGRLAGVISRQDLRAPPRRRIILIDHFESAQTAPGFEHAEILEILDHHRVGDIQTAGPVRVDCRPLGSSSTIVALRFFESGLEPERATATLLLGGVMADTLCLTGPTTTSADQDVAGRLGVISGLEPREFGLDVLSAGDDLLTADPATIWNRDQKSFTIRNRTFAVAQLETVSLEKLGDAVLDAFRGLLEADFARGGHGHILSALFITDTLKGESWVAACESPAAAGAIARSFGEVQPRPGWTLAPGVVSRKKQIVPALMRVLAEVRL